MWSTDGARGHGEFRNIKRKILANSVSANCDNIKYFVQKFKKARGLHFFSRDELRSSFKKIVKRRRGIVLTPLLILYF